MYRVVGSKVRREIRKFLALADVSMGFMRRDRTSSPIQPHYHNGLIVKIYYSLGFKKFQIVDLYFVDISSSGIKKSSPADTNHELVSTIARIPCNDTRKEAYANQ